MIERVYVNEARAMLNGVCWKTLKNWCVENSVALLKDKGIDEYYILREEFDLAFNLEPEKYLLKKYKTKDWSEILEARLKFISDYRRAKEKRPKPYVPQGDHEIAFFTALRKELGLDKIEP